MLLLLGCLYVIGGNRIGRGVHSRIVLLRSVASMHLSTCQEEVGSFMAGLGMEEGTLSLSGLIKHTWKKIARELGNAQQLLREFETKHQARRGGKYGRPARADKGR